MLIPFGNPVSFFEETGQTICDFGHSFTGSEKNIHSGYPEIEEYTDAMLHAYGKDRAEEILSVNRFNTVIYPNLSIKCNLQTMRVFHPISVDQTIMEAWTFRLKGAPEEMLRRTMLYNQILFSPASMAAHDDNEAFGRMQGGLESEGKDWVDMSRHLDNAETNSDGTISAPGTSDIAIRNEFEAWKTYIGAAQEAGQ